MAFEFNETVNLILPSVEEQLDQFSEHLFRESHGLIAEVAAIHAGVTANYNNYSEAELAKSLRTWIEPYPRPVILNHNVENVDPIGRVIGAKMDKEPNGVPFVRLQAAITDPEAIQKVKDKRYLTGSVGGRAEEAVCSICGTDWAKPQERSGLPCKHRRGKTYSGQIATMDMRNISFKEYSFVNVPADSDSGVRSVSTEVNENDDFIKPVRFFCLDMDSEGIFECTESGSVDVLAEMKKKDASSLHLETKGAFIEAQIVNKIEQEGAKRHKNDTNHGDSIERHSEENVMAKEVVETVEEDDILAVTEELSADLAAPSADVEEDIDEEEDLEDVEPTAEEAEGEDTDEVEESEDTEEDLGDESEEVEEGERPEAQSKSGKDVDPETSEGAPRSRESDEEDADLQEATTEEEVTEEELTETSEDVDELLVEELQARVDTLEEENAKLRSALHRTLVERVVDAKIAIGMVEADARSESIEEHAGRTASSLADTLRDLAKISPVSPAAVEELEMDSEIVVTGDEINATLEDGELEEAQEADPMVKAEDFFVDVLMGKIKA